MLAQTDLDMSKKETTRPQISDDRYRDLQVLHEATFNDLLDARNYTFQKILEERNILICER